MRELIMVSILLLGIAFALAGCDKSADDTRRTAMLPEDFQEDIVKTSGGELKITFVGHGTLMFTFEQKIIHVDPVSREADYTQMPDGDIILVTHEHGDHLDTNAIACIRKEGTTILLPEKCASAIPEGMVMCVPLKGYVSRPFQPTILSTNVLRGNRFIPAEKEMGISSHLGISAFMSLVTPRTSPR